MQLINHTIKKRMFCNNLGIILLALIFISLISKQAFAGATFAYVSSSSATTISLFNIESATSNLIPFIPAFVKTGMLSTGGIFLDPLNRFMYALGTDDNKIAIFKINSDYSLSEKPTSIMSTCLKPFSLQFLPNSQFAYLGCQLENKINVYKRQFDESGMLTLTLVNSYPAPTGVSNISINGKYFYAISNRKNNITIYSINEGQLKKLDTIDARLFAPEVIIFDPEGRHAYINHPNSNSISVYNVVEDGKLKFYSIIKTGDAPAWVSFVPPDGKFAYIINTANNTISMFSHNSVTGGLVPLKPNAIMRVGSIPSYLTFDNKGHAYLLYNSQNLASLYSIESSGALKENFDISLGVIAPSKIIIY